MNPILIQRQKNPKIHYRDLADAEIAIVVGDTHFQCIKNRYAASDVNDKIPNDLLSAYLLRFYDAHDLVDKLIGV